MTPDVSVVVPYYLGRRALERLLAGLDAQELAPGRFEVVVADDGSPQPPSVGRRAYQVTVVRQDDLGFRVAAARNLGAAAATGRVLCFLDQDCVPTPGYLSAVLRAATDWSLLVGRRRHAVLHAWDGPGVRQWLAGGAGPAELPSPTWLVEGYARTHALAEPDERAYQLVLGATTSVSRDLFVALGGFDEGIHGYGGEDWDLGHRAWVAGAQMRFVDDAVVWHDGPDVTGRPLDLAATKNRETLTLAGRIPDPDVRGAGLVWRVPDVIVELDPGDAEPAAIVASVESLLAGTDAGVWVGAGPGTAAALDVLEDTRVHLGSPAADIWARARYVVRCGAVLLDGHTLRSLARLAPLAAPGFRLVSLRDRNRSRRGLSAPAARPVPPGALRQLAAAEMLETLWRDRSSG